MYLLHDLYNGNLPYTTYYTIILLENLFIILILIAVNEFILLSKEKHGYNTEQAMGMLYWHNYDLKKAISDLPNFAPKSDDWTPEDMVLFEAALSQHGKNFSHIKRMVLSFILTEDSFNTPY